METWVWVVLIIGILLLLAGLGVGLYFAFRKKPEKSNGGTKGGTTQRGGSTPNKTTTCKSTSAGQPGTLGGEFSLIPAGSPHTALTISESSQSSNPQAILSSDPSKIYAWTTSSYQTKTANIPNVLRFVGDVEGKFGCNEAILLTSDYKADLPAFVGKPGSLKFQNQFMLSWKYGIKADQYQSTLCDVNGSGYCLYYDASRTGSVVAKQFNSSDLNFRWYIGPPKPTL